MTLPNFIYLYFACGAATALGLAVRSIASADTIQLPSAPIHSLLMVFVISLVFCACIILAGLTWPLHVTKVFADDTSR